MRLSGIRYIYEARLEARAVLVQEVFAILGIAVGVALLFASQVSSASLTRAVALLNSQLVGSTQLQLQARGPEGVSERLLGEVQRVRGVQVALPVLERQVNVIGPRGERPVTLFGVEPQAVRASGPLLRRFSARQLAAQRAIALPGPIAQEVGAGPLVVVKLQLGGSFVETLVGATLGEADIGGLVHSPVALAPLGYAQRLTRAEGQVSRIFVRYAPARSSQVHAALARLAARWNVNLEPGTFDTHLFSVAVAPQSKSESLFSAISALVGFMFALNAMLITVPSRRKLIRDLRPHGATQLMIIEILLFDAAVIGVLACVIGLILGNVLSIAVFHSTPGYLTFAFPVGNSRIVTWQSIALAITAGMAAAVVGVFWPLLEMLRSPRQARVLKASRASAWRTARFTAATACLAITTATLLIDSKAAIIGNVTLVAALVLLLPFLSEVAVRLFGHLSNALDGIGSALAVTELGTPQTRVRSLAIIATAAIAVLGIVEFQGTQANLKSGLYASTRDLDGSADVWVTPRGDFSLLNTVAFTPAETAALARLPGVAQVGLYRGSLLDWGERRLEIRGQPSSARQPVPPSQFLGHDLALATARVRGGGWAVLSQALASEHHLQVGQSFTLPSPRPIALRLAGVTTNLGWPPGAIVLNSQDYAHAWNQSEPTAYEIQTTAGASAASVRDLVRRTLGPGTGLVVETASEREQRHYALANQGLSRLTQIRMLVLIAAILAIIGAMASMIWQRRERIAAMKCHGYREAVLWRWLLCESGVLLLTGCLSGAIFGLYAQLLGSHFLGSVTGFPVVFKIEGFAAISSFGLVSAIAVVIVSIPGYLAVRVPPRTVSSAY
jgi:putative ABC transport system permease protein